MKTRIQNSEFRIQKWALLLAFSFQLSAFSQLSVTVTPGYQFSANERPTATTLNLLGTPSLLISGTVPGTTISTNSINGAQLADNVVDTNTISFTNTSPSRRLQVSTNALGYQYLRTNVAGRGLYGGSTTNLHVQVSSNSITVNTNNAIYVPVSSNSILGSVNGGTEATNVTLGPGLVISNNVLQLTNVATVIGTQVVWRAVITNIALPVVNSCITNAHGLGVVPSVRSEEHTSEL